MKRYSGRKHIVNSVRHVAQYGAKPDTADSFVESILDPMDRVISGAAEALRQLANGDTEQAMNELEFLLREYAEDAPQEQPR